MVFSHAVAILYLKRDLIIFENENESYVKKKILGKVLKYYW
jgi:hypothetical protein